MKRWLPALSVFVTTLRLDAQAPALGPEFQVREITTQPQAGSQVAADAAGNFVVVWSGYGTGGAHGVLSRRFDADGAPLGPEVVVSTFTGACCADVAMTPSGDFVVVWRDLRDGGYYGGYGVVARRYDGAGSPTSPEIPVNTYTTGNQIFQRADIDPAGNFVVVWASLAGQDGWGYGIFGQRFSGAGVKQGPEFRVNTETFGHQNFPDVAVDPAGGFVVVWEGYRADVSGVLAQRYDAVGLPLGEEFVISQYSGPGWRALPNVDSDSLGDFVVTWMSSQQTNFYFDVLARRFRFDGTPRGDEFRIHATEETVSQTAPEVAVGADGAFTIAWNAFYQPETQTILARRYDAAGRPSTAPFQLNALTTFTQNSASVAVDERGGFVILWDCSVLSPDSCLDGGRDSIAGRRGGVPDARPMSVDASGGNARAGGSDLNGVLETEELVAVAPAWNNNSGADLLLTGAASDFTGPAGPDYLLMDATADYGTIPGDATNDCTVTGDCLTVGVSGTRPTLHWDATFDEALSSGATKTWTLHVGGSFGDVPVAHQFYGFIENVFHNGITSGCGGGNYCPSSSVTREQMAVFLLKSEHSSDYVPPPCSGTFPDVTCPGHPFADWIEQLSTEGITGGCGGGNYCPDNPVTRAQMAVFLLKTKNGSTYTPPTCTGVFGDVACPGNPFADWIEQLAAEQITGGCGSGNYCPDGPNTRGQMAVFLVKTFSLALYGP